MKRVSFANAVHFAGHGCATLCGFADADLLGNPRPLAETAAPVTCPSCATLYCRIKNAPWNEVEEKTMDNAMCEAVKENDNARTPLQ